MEDAPERTGGFEMECEVALVRLGGDISSNGVLDERGTRLRLAVCGSRYSGGEVGSEGGSRYGPEVWDSGTGSCGWVDGPRS